MKRFLCGWAFGALVVAILWAPIESPRQRVVPLLIGHDCIGAGGDVWAMDESDFPTSCEEIERY